MVDFVKNLEDSQLPTVLIVSHGSILVAGIMTLLGYPAHEACSRGGLDNASVTILETFDVDHFMEICWNDTSYKQ
ncbi:histidine phosphatase family protein [Streptococcus suis]|uniref:histidine phosphatase family protein n=1 Tax=Streptococcus suis TaxID=1307 RepID=UPI003D811A54